MTDISAAPSSAKTPEFSAAPWPAVRKALEIIGWLVVAVLLYTGLSSVFGRADFLITSFAQPIADPRATFTRLMFATMSTS